MVEDGWGWLGMAGDGWGWLGMVGDGMGMVTVTYGDTKGQGSEELL